MPWPVLGDDGMRLLLWLLPSWTLDCHPTLQEIWGQTVCISGGFTWNPSRNNNAALDPNELNAITSAQRHWNETISVVAPVMNIKLPPNPARDMRLNRLEFWIYPSRNNNDELDPNELNAIDRAQLRWNETTTFMLLSWTFDCLLNLQIVCKNCVL